MLSRYEVRVDYCSGKSEIVDNSLEEAIERAKNTSYMEGETVYITQVIAKVKAERPKFDSEVSLVEAPEGVDYLTLFSAEDAVIIDNEDNTLESK